MYKVGDIILTPFPFTDLSGNKVRPALILGVQDVGDDVTVCFISSVIHDKLHKFDVLVDPKDKDFNKTGLKLKSVIKIVKIATLDKIVVLGKMGMLDLKNLNKVKEILKIY
ncbi:MAG: type II toxin-antitoxin system PemK/MazF family toxin, partial [Nanoarchaeota archaeon]|nr:type II toxin-antitoxin system PemK/MazF family toxin [Nanoarchaeota archaeon]